MDQPLREGIAEVALAFRGYNITNLGRTAELLAIPAYAPIVRGELTRLGRICSEVVNRPVDLIDLVVNQVEPGLDQYAEAISLVVAVEAAQLRLLREVHGVDYSQAKLSFGYSLGEMTAVCSSGGFDLEELVRVPLAMAEDCADLARDAEMGVLFSRGGTLPEADVRRLCLEITRQGRGTIGVSAVLSPNTYLLMGQGYSVDRFKEEMAAALPGAHLRINTHRWPPLHTPIVRQRRIADRAGVLMERLTPGNFPLKPPVVSLVTGKRSYEEHTAREILRQWVDHPQRLWDAVCETLASGAKAVLHIGPTPNVVPATFSRVSENVKQQLNGKTFDRYRVKAMSGLAKRPWLAALLPARAALLRAPFVEQIILEDWLLERAPREPHRTAPLAATAEAIPAAEV
jgi:[acyl-carrier-protein] S-malonyltransferase